MEEAIINTLTLRMRLTKTADGQYDPKRKYKQHNLSHYPSAIRLAGPLSLQSSSLCEQFQQFSIHKQQASEQASKQASEQALNHGKSA